MEYWIAVYSVHSKIRRHLYACDGGCMVITAEQEVQEPQELLNPPTVLPLKDYKAPGCNRLLGISRKQNKTEVCNNVWVMPLKQHKVQFSWRFY